MSQADQTNAKPRQYRRRKAKGKNARQDQRLKQLEKMVFTSLERKSKTWQNGIWGIGETATVINNSNSDNLLLTQGTESDEMMGNKINLLNQTVRFCLHLPDPISDTWNKVRILICEPKEGTETLSISDVLTYTYSTSSSPPIASETAMCSPYAVATPDNKRYIVHYDKVFELNEYNHNIMGKVKIKFGKDGKVVNFEEFRSTGGNKPTDHNLHVFAFSDSSATPHPALALNIRSNYYDA